MAETELYKYASPEMVGDRENLEKILALKDPLIIQDLMQRGKDEREALLGLPTIQTLWILTVLSRSQTDWVSSYLLELPSPSQVRLVEFFIRDRALVSLLQETEGLQAQFNAVLSLAEDFAKVDSILSENAG